MDPLDYDLTYPKNRALWSNISGNSGKIKVVYKKAVDDYQLKSSILDRNDDSWISGRTVQGDYPVIEGNFSLRLGGMLRIWVWRRRAARSFIGILILPLMGAEILSPEGLKRER
jgi:hypothetical protein